MEIKYHDNKNGVQYGEDHMLTNNWDPNLDYGNEYVSVYFRIDTPTYRCGNGIGFTNNEDRDLWNKEASELISSFGILEDSGYKVEHSDEKRAYLYAHPDDISGVILKNDVKKIAEAIEKMKLSSIRWVDLYETVYIISNDEYNEYLNGKKETIRKLLFEKSHTPRTTKYYSAFDIARDVANSVRLNRLGLNDGLNYGSGQTIEYILNVVNEMINEGLLKYFDQSDMRYIRSLNKTEQKQMKIKIA